MDDFNGIYFNLQKKNTLSVKWSTMAVINSFVILSAAKNLKDIQQNENIFLYTSKYYQQYSIGFRFFVPQNNKKTTAEITTTFYIIKHKSTALLYASSWKPYLK